MTWAPPRPPAAGRALPSPRPPAAGQTRPPSRLTAPPSTPRAGWYADPFGYPIIRYYDGSRWTQHTTGALAARGSSPAHSVLDIRVAIGAVVVLLVSLVASRYLLDYLVRFDWPIAVFAAISAGVGYGPSVAWCVYASHRWGSGSLVADLGLRFRWSDVGWGPVIWLTAVLGQAVAVLVVELTGIPLIGNTEGLRDLDLDRTYVISLLVTAVVAAPVVEEMVFRGLVLRGLLSRINAAAAVAVQGVLFGAAHIDPARGVGNIGLVLILSVVGVVLGGGAYLLRRIGPVIIAHAIFNGVVMAIVLTR
jgi:membrane protease YdiL (CAAX protease family)